MVANLTRHSQGSKEKYGHEEKGRPDPAAANNDNKILLVQFEEGDPENPMNWSNGRKWLIVRLGLSLSSPPRWREKLTASTWPCRPSSWTR